MTDVVVTVPKEQWVNWLAEGDLPGEEAQYESHFWIPRAGLPHIDIGDRVYVVAHGRLRGYAPLTNTEASCRLNRNRACLIREGGAVAVTIPEPIRGFQGWRYRWWARADEAPFPDWQQPDAPVPATLPAPAAVSRPGTARVWCSWCRLPLSAEDLVEVPVRITSIEGRPGRAVSRTETRIFCRDREACMDRLLPGRRYQRGAAGRA